MKRRFSQGGIVKLGNSPESHFACEFFEVRVVKNQNRLGKVLNILFDASKSEIFSEVFPLLWTVYFHPFLYKQKV